MNKIRPTCVTEGRTLTPLEHLKRLDIAVHIEDLTVRHSAGAALWDIDLELPKGVLLAVIGPEGAGKTTLLKSILGLVKPSAGHVFIFGKPALKQKKMLAYVPPRNSVDWDFPINVFDAVLMGTYAAGGWFFQPGRSIKQSVVSVLKKAGLYGEQTRWLSELSNGKKQRVLLARALLQNAEIYLLDEPFQSIDAASETIIADTIQQLRNNGKTVAVVHSDLKTLREYFDWVMILNKRLIAVGPVAETLTEDNMAAAFGGKSRQADRSYISGTLSAKTEIADMPVKKRAVPKKTPTKPESKEISAKKTATYKSPSNKAAKHT
jgi:manganese/zinc/iron transport system ATP- binding protein